MRKLSILKTLNPKASLTAGMVAILGVSSLCGVAHADSSLDKRLKRISRRLASIEASVSRVQQQRGPVGPQGPKGNDGTSADVNTVASRVVNLVQPSVSALDSRLTATEQLASSVGTYIEEQLAPVRSTANTALNLNRARGSFDTISRDYFPEGAFPIQTTCAGVPDHEDSQILEISAAPGTYVVQAIIRAHGVDIDGNYVHGVLKIESTEGGQIGYRVATTRRLGFVPTGITETVVVAPGHGLRLKTTCFHGVGLPIESITYFRIAS